MWLLSHGKRICFSTKPSKLKKLKNLKLLVNEY